MRRLAVRLLALACPPDIRDALLGDLEEEYRRRLSRGLPADSWYWREAVVSLWPLAHARLNTSPALALLIATATGYLLVQVWDRAIARSLAGLLAGSWPELPVASLRAAYIGAQMLGVAAAAGLVTYLVPGRSARFSGHPVFCVLPLAALLVLPVLWVVTVSDDRYPITFRLAWFAAAVPALGLGARWGMALRARSAAGAG